MHIELFSKENGLLDSDSLKAGVYEVTVSLLKDRTKEFPLYIGESFCMVDRCGTHIYNVQKNPMYFGLTNEQFNDDSLVLSFRVYEVVEKCWDNYKERDAILEQHELAVISQIHPVSQYTTNDHVRSDANKYVSEAIATILSV